jgi:hypothetical protein
MTETVKPKPQFRSVTEAAAVAALNNPDPANPIAVEIARLIAGYTKNFCDHVERLGYIPAHILSAKPRCPIEAVAMRWTTETIRDSLAHPKSPDA